MKNILFRPVRVPKLIQLLSLYAFALLLCIAAGLWMELAYTQSPDLAPSIIVLHPGEATAVYDKRGEKIGIVAVEQPALKEPKP